MGGSAEAALGLAFGGFVSVPRSSLRIVRNTACASG